MFVDKKNSKNGKKTHLKEKTMSIKPDTTSKALEINLENTRAKEVIIPESHLELINCSSNYWGIQKRTREFFHEYHHPYSNNTFVAEELRKILLSDIWFYQTHEDAEKNYNIFSHVISDFLERNLTRKVQDLVVLSLTEFLSQYGSQNDALDKIWGSFYNLLEKCYRQFPRVVCDNSHFLKKSFSEGLLQPKHQEQSLLFTKEILKTNLVFWKTETVLEKWLKDNQNLFSKDYTFLNEQIGSGYFNKQLSLLEDIDNWKDLTYYIPSHSEIAANFRNCINCFDKNRERFYFLIFLLKTPGMRSLHDQLLWEINKLLRSICSEMGEEELTGFIDQIFKLFKDLRETHLSMVLDCMLTLGKEVKESNHRKVISFLENKFIEFGFTTPGLVYMKEDWQIHVDPNHIKHIRIWLELIESAPYTFRKLLSALIVNLRLGGIFIFDTDLFQRDISRLLNSNILPIYKHVKQLARIFPVYFNEIGAEGELREVTTLVDEMSGRQDKLIHFLRKQVHIEGNNSHIDLTFKIVNFWFDGDKESLKPFLPEDVYNSIDLKSKWFSGIHKLIKALIKENYGNVKDLLNLGKEEFEVLLNKIDTACPNDKKRVKYIYRLYYLLREKYSFDATDTRALLSKYPFFRQNDIDKLHDAIASKEYENAIRVMFGFMKQLSDVIFDPAYSEGWESIYHKRHIAFGIPSMYGQYRETKFEALGLTYRLERITNGLMEEEIYGFNYEYITARSLNKIYSYLKLFRDGLELDGITNQGFESNLQMLRYGLTSESFSLNQYINLFQFMAHNIQEIIHTYFYRFYDQPLRMIVPQLFSNLCCKNENDLHQLIHKKSELFYRDIMSTSFLIQLLDNFIFRVLDSLRNMVENLNTDALQKIMTYDPELVISPLYENTEKLDNQIFLGSKAFFLKKLFLLGFPVPPGFVLTTEVFRRRKAISAHKAIENELNEIVKDHLGRLEKISGKRYGDPQNPLLLSVRSGTAISMPGAMNTFLNVGMNDEITEALSKRPNFGWTSWDCYRRFLQSWGMAHGINRDVFDKIMIRFKNKYKVDQKIQFTSDQMKEMTYEYKNALKVNGVIFQNDPLLQLQQAILNVFDSWSSERAIVYREHLQIASQWGTAVVIQQMVLGNIDEKSGTGVVFTHSPHIAKPGIYLNGDFTLCSQGEDIVAGLVHALPVSDFQKSFMDENGSITLQGAFPKIYKKLDEIARQLMEQFGFGHQEIEFTFEGQDPERLFILQVRDQDTRKSDKITVFKSGNNQKVGHGAGGGGGALNGYVAFDMDDLKLLMKKYPGKNRILIRPDTVPDDIAMIFECDGLITARGGTTSHAAVAAARMGKVCVLNCRHLKVDEFGKTCSINGQVFNVGDKIAIDGHFGNIFKGHCEIEHTEVFSLNP